MTTVFAQYYDDFLHNKSDPRVKDWVGFQTPTSHLNLIGMYLMCVYILLPMYMKNRPAYCLKRFVFWYNIFQIVVNSIIAYKVGKHGWFKNYSWSCEPVDYSNDPDALVMLNCCYYLHHVKGIDFIETFVFILRKKYNQVSKLHVYHHVSTFMLTWVGVKFVGGGMATFPILLNCSVHVLMYSYYLLSSLGSEWQKRVNKWKSTLTVIQMVQFFIIIAHAMQSLNPSCHVPKQLLLIYVPNVLLVFYMFWEFYKKSYTKKEK